MGFLRRPPWIYLLFDRWSFNVLHNKMPSSRTPFPQQEQEDQMTFMRTIQPSMTTKMLNIRQQTPPIAFELVAKYGGDLPKYVQDAMVECDGCGKPDILFGFHQPLHNQDYCQDCAYSLDTEGWIAFHPKSKQQ